MRIPDAVSAEVFHTAGGTAFVDVLINGKRETWPIRSQRFRTWLRRRHYETTRTAASAAAASNPNFGGSASSMAVHGRNFWQEDLPSSLVQLRIAVWTGDTRDTRPQQTTAVPG